MNRNAVWAILALQIIIVALGAVILFKFAQQEKQPQITVNYEAIEISRNKQDSIRIEGDKDIATIDTANIDHVIDLLAKYRERYQNDTTRR